MCFSDTNNKTNPIEFWIKEGRWPIGYFEQDDQTRKGLERVADQEYWVPETELAMK